jgi:hypothetical protein
VTRPLPWEGTTKEDVMWMVEATAMVYKVMEEQHKIDSFAPALRSWQHWKMKCISMN